MTLKIKNILEQPLSEETVREMMKMADSQSEEWKQLFDQLPPLKLLEYAEMMGKIQKLECQKKYKKMSQREKEIKHLKGFDFVAHRSDGLSFEANLLQKAEERENEKYSFFWATKSAFSQWHKCKFKAERIYRTPDYLEEVDKEILFTSAEQYMMYHKCMLALDFDAAQKVLTTSDPKKQKQIGRSIKMSEEILETWDFFKAQIVYDGNKAKFEQNEDLKKELLATVGTTIVEAAPNDKVWGIGLAEDDPRAQKRENWLGKNLLGEILTIIRKEMEKQIK